MANPLQPILASQGFVMLDGGVSSELEFRGIVLSTDLWSAVEVIQHPDVVCQAHAAFYEAGSNVGLACCYQCHRSLVQACSVNAAHDNAFTFETMLSEAVRLVTKAAQSDDCSSCARICAASCGSYGSALQGGQEFVGKYTVPADFQLERAQLLTEAGVQMLCFETIPQAAEAYGIAEMMQRDAQLRTVPYTISVSCRNGTELCEGSSFRDFVLHMLTMVREGAAANLVGIGINCTSPDHISSLLRFVSDLTSVSDKLLFFVKPNAGGWWNPDTRLWEGEADDAQATEQWKAWLQEWYAFGVRGFGGCCRVRPHHIRLMRNVLESMAQKLS
jgi:homocysteine S-methyltransferase